jgi:hypothetical protein
LSAESKVLNYSHLRMVDPDLSDTRYVVSLYPEKSCNMKEMPSEIWLVAPGHTRLYMI